MTDLYNSQGEWKDGKSMGPVFVLDDENLVDEYPIRFTGKWLLTSELYVTGGGKQAVVTLSAVRFGLKHRPPPQAL